MGGAGVADPTSPANAVYNPANILGDDGVFAFYDNYKLYGMTDIYDSGIAATRTWPGTGVRAALAVRQVFHHFESPVHRTVFLPEGTGNGYEAKDRGTGVTAAVSAPILGATVAFGFAVERALLDSNVDDNVSAWAFDTGVRVDLAVQNDRGDLFEPHLGVSLLNAGNGFEWDSNHADSPQQVRVGLGARFISGATVPIPLARDQVHIATVSFDCDVVTDDPANSRDTATLGGEVGFLETVFFRIGAGGLVSEQRPGVSYGAGVALGISSMRFHADFAVYPSRAVFEDEETVWGLSLAYRP